MHQIRGWVQGSALATLLLSSAHAVGNALFAANICTPDKLSVVLSPKVEKWVPGLKQDLLAQLSKYATAYHLSKPCADDNPLNFRYLLVIDATDAIANGSRAYVAHLALTNGDVGFTAYYDFATGISAGGVFNNRENILALTRGLIDSFAETYAKANP